MAGPGRRTGMAASALVLLAALLSACGGQVAPATFGPPRPGGTTPTAADIAAIAALGAAFDPARSATADLETAKVEAKRGSKRIVLELGDAACGDCAALDERIEGEAPLRHLRDAGFVWVKVDRSAPANVAFLGAYPGRTEAAAPDLRWQRWQWQ